MRNPGSGGVIWKNVFQMRVLFQMRVREKNKIKTKIQSVANHLVPNPTGPRPTSCPPDSSHGLRYVHWTSRRWARSPVDSSQMVPRSPLDFSPIGEKSSGLLGGGCFQSLLSWPRLVIYQTPPLPPPFPIAARNARLSLHQIFSFARFACVFVNI